ncbi:MAG: YjfB family protein [Hydrogenophaga sp.]|nr:YjfB family protein [Hydrogenophaga sp.]
MDLDISPALLVESMVQTRQEQTAQEVQLFVLKKAMDMQATASAALLNAVAGDLLLASGGAVGTRLNTLV